MPDVDAYILEGANPPVITDPGSIDVGAYILEEPLLLAVSTIVLDDTVYAGPRIREYHPLGGGIVRPFYRAEHGDFCSDQGVNTVLSNVGQIFGTARGTLPWRTEFGSDLQLLRHRANNFVTRDLAMVYVREALTLWEPRVHLRSLETLGTRAPDDNQLNMRALLEVEGSQGSLRLDVPSWHNEDFPPTETLRAWAAAGRVPRGMGYLTEGPAPFTVPEDPFTVGLVRPFFRTKDFRSARGVPVILSNVGQVLGTAKRTLPWRPEFGSDLERLRHRANNPAVKELARLYAEEALRVWEPRAELTRIEQMTSPDVDGNILNLRILTRISLFEESPYYPLPVTIGEPTRVRSADDIGGGGGGGGGPVIEFNVTGATPGSSGVGAESFLFQRELVNSSYAGPLVLQFDREVDPASLSTLVVNYGGISPPAAWAGPQTLRATEDLVPALLPLTFTVVGDTIEITNDTVDSHWGTELGGGGELWIQLTDGLLDTDGNPLTNAGDVAYWSIFIDE